MSSRIFKGVNAVYLEQYVQLKRGLGYKYASQKTILLMFDRFTTEHDIKTVGISREIAYEWSIRRPNETESSRYNRIRNIAGFSSFLNDLGIRSFIPRIPRKTHTFIPYIFSKAEMARFLTACDALRLEKTSWNSCIISGPVIFRILYGTGLRISEAVALRDRDVNLTDKYLLVKNSKNGKERMVPISDSLVDVCEEYLGYRNRLPYGRKGDLFFVTLNGNKCIAAAIRRMFHRILIKAEIPYLGRENGPRLHDIRHTFAVHSLAMMAESGVDLYTSLPVLSTYLGHQLLESTDQYVRLTSEMYPNLLKDIDIITLNVFLKITDDENK